MDRLEYPFSTIRPYHYSNSHFVFLRALGGELALP